MIINIRKAKKKGFKNYAQEIACKQKKQDNRYLRFSQYCRCFWVWKGKFSGSLKEKEIFYILNSNNILFYCEVLFERELNKRFDFYLPKYDLVIEYDGQQHFNSLTNIKNDIIKEEILSKRGIKLLRYNNTHTNLNDCIYKDLKQYLN